MNKNVFDMFLGIVGLALMLAVPLGLLLSYHLENNTWLLMSIISFLILAAKT